jgi:hypothetical protein
MLAAIVPRCVLSSLLRLCRAQTRGALGSTTLTETNFARQANTKAAAARQPVRPRSRPAQVAREKRAYAQPVQPMAVPVQAAPRSVKRRTARRGATPLSNPSTCYSMICATTEHTDSYVAAQYRARAMWSPLQDLARTVRQHNRTGETKFNELYTMR